MSFYSWSLKVVSYVDFNITHSLLGANRTIATHMFQQSPLALGADHIEYSHF